MTKSLKRVVGIASALAALIVPTSALATPGPVAAPAIPGVAGLPGPLVDPGKPATTMLTLKAAPDIAVAGTMTTISGTGLPANKDVNLTWSTATIDWVLDARPDSVDYLGRKATNFPVLLAKTQTDATGAFKLTLAAPRDWGGLHDIYAVVDGVQVAKGGFLISRHATMTPKSGPIGTPITITYSGLGSKLYEGSVALNWDNHFAGQLTANWSRGVAVAHIRASGPVGKHVVYLDDAVNFGYMNIPQSPNPWAVSKKFIFTVTKDAGRPAARIDWPLNLTPTVSPTTTLAAVKSVAGVTTGTAALSVTSGKILTKVDDPKNFSLELPGISFCWVEGGPSVQDAVRGFVRVESGVAFPEHEHFGEENVLVLQGSYTDSVTGEVFRPGDIATMSAGSSHGFVVPANGPDLLKLSVVRKGLRAGDKRYEPR